jgi:hypothetical protein
MRYFLTIFLLFPVSLVLLSSCKKNDEAGFFIEATINGVKWKANSTGDYLAARSDNSQMKVFIGKSDPDLGSFNFFSNSSLTPFYWNETDFTLQNGYIAPFDSKLLMKWETTFQNNIDKFYIQQSISNPETYQIIDSVKGGGYGYFISLKQYSFKLPDVKIYYLNQVKYRIWVFLAGGASYYTSSWPASISPGKVQIVYTDPNGKVYFPLDNDQNQLTVTSYDPVTGERSGTFSFNYKDDSGNIIAVKNGKFHLKP